MTTDKRTPDGNTIPIEARQFGRREDVAALLGVSERTINRRVNTGDIERVEHEDGTASFRPKLTPWTRSRLNASTASTTPLRQPSTPLPRHVEGGAGVEAEEPHRSTASTPSTHVEGSVASTASTSSDVLQNVEAIEQQIERQVEHITELEQRVEHLEGHISPNNAEATERGADEKGHHHQEEESHARENGSWWLRLMILVLSRLKMWLDRLLKRLEA